jgi:hypothetical protein
VVDAPEEIRLVVGALEVLAVAWAQEVSKSRGKKAWSSTYLI